MWVGKKRIVPIDVEDLCSIDIAAPSITFIDKYVGDPTGTRMVQGYVNFILQDLGIDMIYGPNYLDIDWQHRYLVDKWLKAKHAQMVDMIGTPKAKKDVL